MDYFNLYTNSIWHINPDGSGFEKLAAYDVWRMAGAYRNLPRLAQFPISKAKQEEKS